MFMAPYDEVQEVWQVPLLQAVLGVGAVLDAVLVQHKDIQPVLLGYLWGAVGAVPAWRPTHNTPSQQSVCVSHIPTFSQAPWASSGVLWGRSLHANNLYA
jgi:hypothetical protein